MSGYQSDPFFALASELDAGIIPLVNAEDVASGTDSTKAMTAAATTEMIRANAPDLLKENMTIDAVIASMEDKYPPYVLEPNVEQEMHSFFVKLEERNISNFKISVLGRFNKVGDDPLDEPTKILKMYFGKQSIVLNAALLNPIGDFKAEVVLKRVSEEVRDWHIGYASIAIDGVANTMLQTLELKDWSPDDKAEIRLTLETSLTNDAFVYFYYFITEKTF